MTTNMDGAQRQRFLTQGARTGVLSTVRADGRPHAAPVWFVLDGEDVIFMTGRETVKGRNLLRSGQAAFTVDDREPPYAFVTITGTVETSEDLAVMLPWSTAIAERYVGAAQAAEFGRRNAVAGELLVRLRPDRVVAQAGIAD